MKRWTLALVLALTTGFAARSALACDCQQPQAKKAACDCAGGSCPGPCPGNDSKQGKPKPDKSKRGDTRS